MNEAGEGRAAPEQLWREHGWGLGGRAVAAVVGLILLASVVVQMLG